MRHGTIFVIISSFILAGCKKELSLDTSGGSSSSGTCNTYFPLTTGDTWTYDIGGSLQVNTVITPDSVIAGKTFKRLSQNLSGTITTGFVTEDNNGNVYLYV